MAAFALVLFDIDGCTAIVNSEKLCLGGKPYMNGQQGHMRHGRERLRVEILQQSDSKKALKEFEDEWSTLGRSMALAAEKKKRNDKPHGYLCACPLEMNPDIDNRNTGKKRKGQEKTNEKTKQGRILHGSNGNKVHILYEGSGSTTSDVAEPKIPPCYLDELTPDEQDLVKSHIEQYKRGNFNVGTQTDPVVVLGPEDVLPALNPIVSPAVMRILAQIQETQRKTLAKVKALCTDVQRLNGLADD